MTCFQAAEPITGVDVLAIMISLHPKSQPPINIKNQLHWQIRMLGLTSRSKQISHTSTVHFTFPLNRSAPRYACFSGNSLHRSLAEWIQFKMGCCIQKHCIIFDNKNIYFKGRSTVHGKIIDMFESLLYFKENTD